MVKALLSCFLSLLVSATSAVASFGRHHRFGVKNIDVPGHEIVFDVNGTELPPLNTTYYFDQLIDHTDPSLGTFKQRYWHTWEFYERGGPIVLSTPGERSAGGGIERTYLTNKTIIGMIAQELGGATIFLEHRYYGESNPFSNLSTASLRYHTIEQAIDDLEYFAYNVKLAMPGGNHVTPNEAPWILVGCSYAGALTSFTKVNKPNAFYAAWSTSGVVESIVDYWGYFDIVRTHMPQNCSADVQRVIGHIDEVFTSGNETAINEIKSLFGMDLEHLDDFVSALRKPLFLWQALDVSPDVSSSAFYTFCDWLEGDQSAPINGWGLDHALHAWGMYWQYSGRRITGCDWEDWETCIGTYNATSPRYTDIQVGNSDRSWDWILCNEMGFYQTAAPEDRPTIVSRLLRPIYDERQCTYMFPEAFSSPPTPRTNETNAAYDGWLVKADRLIFVNGENDPWRDATVSADGAKFSSSELQPIFVGDGWHCSDLYAENGEADATIAAIQAQGIAVMKGWMMGWKSPIRG